MKEFRVYVLSADLTDELLNFDMSGYSIEEWVLYQEQHNKLTAEAEKFLTVCEEQGNVYSLYGFQNAFNIEETIGANDYIFITNCY